LGDTHAVTVGSFDDAGDPYDGRVLRWSIGGANPAAGSATIGPDGRAEISWSGDRAGRDELTVYLDLDGDDRRDSGEPQAVVAATFVAPAGGATTPPPPTPTTPPAPPAPPTSKPTPPTPTPTPTPPPPPTPMAPTLPDTTAPAGRLLRPRRLRGRTIARSGLRTTVAASEPVTVRQHLYRDMGAPGRAARARVRPKLLGRAVAQLREAGSASVELRLTARGRRTLRRPSTVHVLLQTSLTDHAGNTTRLPHRWLRIRH
jgi:hypothetical protein